MSLLIKGMNVPKDNPVTINIYRDGSWVNAYTKENGEAIEVTPTDAVEVKHGEWCEFMEDPINQRNYGGQTGYYECSNCKFVEDYRPNFCPHCGADMRSET